MCGIVGYKFITEPTPAAVPFIEALLVQSQMRGRHATGIAFPSVTEDGDYDQLVVRKEPIAAEEFLKTEEWNNIVVDPPPAAILHTRYDTSGDWQDNENNQPLVLGDIALVHNGLISMAEKADFEQQYGVQCNTANDSEILLQNLTRTLEQFEDVEVAVHTAINLVAAVEQPIYSCGLLVKDEVYCFADKIRPLYRFSILDYGLEGFCSTKDIFERACRTVGINPEPQGGRGANRVWRCTPGSVYHLRENWHA